MQQSLVLNARSFLLRVTSAFAFTGCVPLSRRKLKNWRFVGHDHKQIAPTEFGQIGLGFRTENPSIVWRIQNSTKRGNNWLISTISDGNRPREWLLSEL